MPLPFFLGGGGVWVVSEVLSQAKMSVNPYPTAAQKKSTYEKKPLCKQNGFLETGCKRINA
ncbi:hypothetical protein B9Z46_13100 [Limnohabitans sp. Hippo4]|jgi:hypothetical protein|nr:hypothetical protein B9Z46_13100 [Limnohabitans sp. Hippo4]